MAPVSSSALLSFERMQIGRSSIPEIGVGGSLVNPVLVHPRNQIELSQSLEESSNVRPCPGQDNSSFTHLVKQNVIYVSNLPFGNPLVVFGLGVGSN